MNKYEQDMKTAKPIFESLEPLELQGKIIDEITLLEEALIKHPDNICLKNRLMTLYQCASYNGVDDELYMNKAVELAIELKETEQYKYSAIQTLAYLYRRLDKQDEIIDDIRKLPSVYESKTWLLPFALKGEERIRAVQANFKLLVDLFNTLLMSTVGREEVGKRDKIYLKVVEFINIVFEDHDYGIIYAHDIQNIYFRCAQDQAQIYNKEKTIYYLKESLKYAKIYDDLRFNKKDTKNTSFLIDRLNDSYKDYSFMSEETLCELLFEQVTDRESGFMFDFIKDAPEFILFLKDTNMK